MSLLLIRIPKLLKGDISWSTTKILRYLNVLVNFST